MATHSISMQGIGAQCLTAKKAAPSVGYGILAADGAGGVKGAQSGESYLIVNVDTTAKTVCVLL